MRANNPVAMRIVVEGLPTLSAKIRALGEAGYACADIARFLNRRYQHVRNVLARKPPKSKSNETCPAEPREPGNVEPKTLRVAENGRVLIPAEMRAAMLINAASHVTARVIEGELRIIAPMAALLKTRKALRKKIPATVSLVDEFIAERRAEARREADE